jgi:hypothetical protein
MDTTRINVANGYDCATKPALSTGIAKVQRRMQYEVTLTDEEKTALEPFLLNPDDVDSDSDDDGDDFDTEVKKKF